MSELVYINLCLWPSFCHFTEEMLILLSVFDLALFVPGAVSRVWCLRWIGRCQCQIQGPCGTCIPQLHSRQVHSSLHLDVCTTTRLYLFVWCWNNPILFPCRRWSQSLGHNNESFYSGSNSRTASKGGFSCETSALEGKLTSTFC